MPGPRPFLAACCILACAPAAAQAPRLINISPHDYPSDVRPGDRLLRVPVRYELGPDGRFALCQVTRSSGQPSLDAASCRLLQERGRACGLSGAPGAGGWSSTGWARRRAA